jgi:hypothetical protein
MIRFNNLINIKFIPTYSKSSVDDEDTNNNIEIFKNHKTNAILLAIMRATEGFNDETIDFAFNLYLNESSNPLLDQQKEGRVARIYKNKQVGYYGFLVNRSDPNYANNIAKRYSDWISYVKGFNKITYGLSHNSSSDNNVEIYDKYLDFMIDKNNIEEIGLDDIQDKIYTYIHNINATSEVGQIRRHMQKINNIRIKKGEEVIDTQRKYQMYARRNNLPENLDMKEYAYNWIRYLRPDFDEYINNFYDETYLKSLKIKNYNDYIMRSQNDIMIPNIELINNGIYNVVNNHFNLQNIYCIKKVKKY